MSHSPRSFTSPLHWTTLFRLRVRFNRGSAATLFVQTTLTCAVAAGPYLTAPTVKVSFTPFLSSIDDVVSHRRYFWFWPPPPPAPPFCLQNHWWKACARAECGWGGPEKKLYGPTTKACSLLCQNFKQICFQICHMSKYLLTMLGQAGWENICLLVMVHEPHYALSVCHDWKGKLYFSIQPSHLVNKDINYYWPIVRSKGLDSGPVQLHRNA